MDDYFHEEEDPERPRDPVLDQAVERLREFFAAEPERLFYSTQPRSKQPSSASSSIGSQGVRSSNSLNPELLF